MNANLAAVLYLIAGSLFILSLARSVEPGIVTPGQLLRHDRYGHCRRDDAGRASAHQRHRLDPRDPRYRHRRRHRCGDRAPRADDLDAGTGRGLPLAGRYGGGAGGGRCVLRACGLRHRHPRQHSRLKPRRNVARRRHRRADLHRLGDRVPEAVGPHERARRSSCRRATSSTSCWPWRWCSSSTAWCRRRARSTSG